MFQLTISSCRGADRLTHTATASPLSKWVNHKKFLTGHWVNLQNTKLEESAPRAAWILFAVCILGVMIQIDYTAVNVALVEIGRSLNINLTMVQWALSAYVLAWGSFVITAGRCADLFGKRRTFILGTLLFMLGSALTGAALQAWFLIFGRVVQGIGGALFLPSLYTLVFTAFPENKRGFALGVLTSAISIGMAMGPTFGGVIIHWLSWRWIFFLNIPLGIPVIGIILWSVQREPLKVVDEPLDWLGALLVALGLVMLMYSFNKVSGWGVGLSLIILTIFIFYERRKKYPLLQLEMFSNRIFLGCNLAYIIMGYTFSTVLIVGGLYLQNALDYSALNTGFIFLVMTTMFASVSIYGGKLVDLCDPRIPILTGLFASAAAVSVLAFCTPQSPLWKPMLALGLYGIGGGLGFPSLNATLLKSMPQNRINTGSSAFTMFGLLGNTLGLILNSILIVAAGKSYFRHWFSAHSWHLNTAQMQQLYTIIGGVHYNSSQFSLFSKGKIPTVLNIMRDAFVHGMFYSMIITLILTLISIAICAVFIKNVPKKSTEITLPMI